MKTILTMVILLMTVSCTKNSTQKNEEKVADESPKSAEINYFPETITAPDASDTLSLGEVSSSRTEAAIKRIYIANKTNTNLQIDLTELNSLLLTNLRYSLKPTTTCTNKVLRHNQVCYFDFSLKHVEGEDYTQPLIFNFLSGQDNTEFGKLILSGTKALDISSSLVMSELLRPSSIAETYSLSQSQTSFKKRFYLSNISANPVIAPSVIAPSNGVVLNDNCSGMNVNPLKSCFFEVSYTYNSSLPLLNEKVLFSSPTLTTAGFEINLSIANAPSVASLKNIQTVVASEIKDISSNQVSRVYVKNTGTVSVNPTMAIPTPFLLKSSNCTPSLASEKSCYYDVQIDPTKKANLLGAQVSLAVDGFSGTLRAGAPLSAGLTCAPGSTEANNRCESSTACSPAQATLNGVVFARSNNTVQGNYSGSNFSSCLLADNACDITSTLSSDKKSCDLKSFAVSITKSAGQVSITGDLACPSLSTSCSQSFDYGSSLSLTATTEVGYELTGWTGCDSVAGSVCSISSLTSAKNIAPVVQLKQLSLSTSYANATLANDVSSLNIYKNNNLCAGACLNSFALNDVAKIVVAPNTFINVDSFTQTGAVSNVITSTPNEVSFTFQGESVASLITLSYKVFPSQPSLSYTGGTLNASTLTTSNSSINIITSNATVAREMLVSTSSNCSTGSYIPLELTKTFSPAQNQTSNLSVQYKNGDKFSQCFNISIIHDSSLPTITIASMPAINDANKSAYNISGTCSENGQSVSLAIGSINSSATCSSLAFSRTLDVSALADGASLASSASISDLAGNSATANTTVLKDVIAPTIAITAMPAINNTNKSAYTISGSCSESSRQVNISIGGINANTTCNLLQFSLTLDVSSAIDSSTLAVSASTSDLAGNSATANTTVLKDVIVPTIAITTMPTINNANKTAYTISGACSENGQSVSLSIGSVNSSATCSSLAFSRTLDVSALADGASIASSATISDLAGNSATANATVLKDVIAPTIANAQSGLISNGGQITLLGTCEGTLPITFTESGNTVNTSINCNSGTYSKPYTVSTGTDGPKTITLTQTDLANNIGTVSVSYTLDKTAPTLSFNALAAASSANSASFPVSGACNENGRSVSITATDSALSQRTGSITCLSSVWSTTINISTLVDGTINFAFQISDLAGNSTTVNSSTIKTSVNLLYADALAEYISIPDNLQTFTSLGSGSVTAIEFSGSNVFVGLNGGIAISQDNGATWTNKTSANGLTLSNTIRSIAISGTNVYVATNLGLSISTDSGKTFTINKTVASGGIASNSIRKVIAIGAKVFLATDAGLSISTDNGTTWTNKTTGNNLPTNQIRGIAVSGTNEVNLFLATNGGGLAISNDGGTTFPTLSRKTQASGLPSDNLSGVWVNGNNIYVATSDAGIAVSTNIGTNWTNSSTFNGSGLPNDTVSQMTLIGSSIFATTNGGGVAISTNNGASWTTRTTSDGLGSDTVNGGLAVNGAKIFVATAAGVASSTNNGVSWTNSLPVGSLSSDSVPSLVANGTNLYVAGNGIAISTNDGTSFVTKTVADGLGSTFIPGIAVDGTKIYAATFGGLSISTDNGNTWITKNVANGGLTNDTVRGVAYSGSNVYVATGNGVAISSDGGSTFAAPRTLANSGLASNSVKGIAISGTTLFAATTAGVSVSTNNGVSWTTRSPVSLDCSSVFVSGSVLYVGTAGGLAISNNLTTAMTFTNITTANGLPSNTIAGLFVNGSSIYVGTTLGLSISTNNGTSWVTKTVADGLSATGVTAISVSGTKIYLGTAAGLTRKRL